MRALIPSLLVLCLLLVSCSGEIPGSPVPVGTAPSADIDPASCAERVTDGVSAQTEWTNGPSECDYFVANPGTGDHMFRVTSSLGIEPGTVVVFDANVQVHVQDGGRITATGSENEPIVFTGAEQSRGYWYGFCFDGNRESTLEHVRVHWGGGVWTGRSHVCNGAISGGSGEGEPVHIVDSVVSGSATSGVSVFGFRLGEFAGNVLADNETYGMRVSARYAARLDDSSDYSGSAAGVENGRPYVFVTGTISESRDTHMWTDLGVPYYVADDHPFGKNVIVTGGAELRVEPGTRFVFGSEGGIHVWDGSVLNVRGTSGRPVVFTGENEVPGTWEGLSFVDAGGVRLEHAEIAWGGADGLDAGNISLHGTGLRNGAQFDDLVIRGSATCGMNIDADLADRVSGGNIRMVDNERNLCGVEQVG